MRIGRGVPPIAVGLIVAVILMASIELGAHAIYPMPAELHRSDRAVRAAFAANLPIGALAMFLTAWAVGTFAGAWTAARIGRGPVHAYIVGALLLAFGVTNIVMVPYPAWFGGTGVVVFGVSTWLAARIASSAAPAHGSS